MLNSYLSLVLAVFFTSFGQLTFKGFADTRKKNYLLLTVALFGIVPIFSLFALKRLSIDIVYVSTAFNISLVSLLSYLCLKEVFEKVKVIGILLITTGVGIYNLL